MPAYSFLDTNFTIAGPGGVVNLAAGAAVAEEGITIEPVEDKNVMTIGADGKGQHSLVASDAKKATVRLLKTSPVNGALMLMFNLQSSSSVLWGGNVLTGNNSALGDFFAGQQVAFKTVPTISYAKEAGFNEWTFDIIKGDFILGSGL